MLSSTSGGQATSMQEKGTGVQNVFGKKIADIDVKSSGSETLGSYPVRRLPLSEFRDTLGKIARFNRSFLVSCCSAASWICFFAFLSPIHAVPVRSLSPKLTAGWPRGVGKVHNSRGAAMARAVAKARMPDHRCAQALAQLPRSADRARLGTKSRTNSTASELQRPATSMASTTSRHRW